MDLLLSFLVYSQYKSLKLFELSYTGQLRLHSFYGHPLSFFTMVMTDDGSFRFSHCFAAAFFENF